MGTRMGPSYACLFMGWIEHQFFDSYTGPVPEVYLRYIDDTQGTTVMERSDLEQFIEEFGKFHPAVGITSEITETSMDTLDLIVSVNEDGTLSTSIYYRPLTPTPTSTIAPTTLDHASTASLTVSS